MLKPYRPSALDREGHYRSREGRSEPEDRYRGGRRDAGAEDDGELDGGAAERVRERGDEGRAGGGDAGNSGGSGGGEWGGGDVGPFDEERERECFCLS